MVTEIPEQASSVDSRDLINAAFKATLTGRALRSVITGIDFKASLPDGEVQLWAVQTPGLWLALTPPILAPRFRLNSQLKFQSAW